MRSVEWIKKRLRKYLIKNKSHLRNLQSDIKVMRPIYLKHEKSRIMNKHKQNRTPEEIKLLESA